MTMEAFVGSKGGWRQLLFEDLLKFLFFELLKFLTKNSCFDKSQTYFEKLCVEFFGKCLRSCIFQKHKQKFLLLQKKKIIIFLIPSPQKKNEIFLVKEELLSNRKMRKWGY